MIVQPAEVKDLSGLVDTKGVLRWRVPQGRWVVERAMMRPTGTVNSPAPADATGYETDKMSRTHIRAHFDAYLGEILRRIPPEDRKTFKIVVEDSYETGGQNWTDSLVADFRRAYGYDPVPYIPVLSGTVVGSEEQSDRFLWDLRRLVADEVAYQYVGGLREISHEHGLTTWLENYGHWGFPGEFLQYGGQSDEVAGEFWSFGDLGNIENRCASSCAHIYGKPKTWAESFTCGGPDFTQYPGQMKQRGDRFFTEGINATLLHLYIQQPADSVPGVNAWFGNEFNRHNTWFSQFDVFARYLKRCNYMLQQGRYVADVAYFIGEDAPKMTGRQDPALPAGYSFDYVNAEVIRQAFVMDGKVQFVLPHGDYIFLGSTGVPAGHFAPYALSEEGERDCIETTEKAIRAMKLDNCAVNCDFIMRDGRTYVLEIGGRSGATCLAELVSIYYGYDYYRKIIQVALGQKPDFPTDRAVPNASKLLMSDRDGTIFSLANRNPKDSEHIVEVKFDYTVGDTVKKFHVGPNRIGHVITKGGTLAEATAALDKALEHIEIGVS